MENNKKKGTILGFISQKIENTEIVKQYKEEYAVDPEAAKKHLKEKIENSKLVSGLNKVSKVVNENNVEKVGKAASDLRNIFSVGRKR